MSRDETKRDLAPRLSSTDKLASSIDVEAAIGEWFWVKSSRQVWDGKKHVSEEYEWLGCVMHIGSNYLLIEEPSSHNGSSTARVHFDDFWKELRHERNAPAVIAAKVAQFQAESQGYLNQIKAITARLGVSKQAQLESPSTGDGSGMALVTLSGQTDIKAYEQALVLAKETQLPELFKEVKEANQEVARWMSAQSLPLLARAAGLEGIIEDVGERIFNVSLYAGLTEQVVRIAQGQPAAFLDKLHVMQRRLYMDEECLAGYRHGGIDFESIEDFDAWLQEPANRNRILPHPRTLVAMRVRREIKEREWDGTIAGAFIKVQLEEADKTTFFYIRNGERLYRLSCDLQFDESIIPDLAEFDPSEPLMVKLFGRRIDKLVSVGEYEAQKSAYLAEVKAAKKWERDNPASTWDEKANGPRWMRNPHRPDSSGFREADWEPFDPSSVYFDDASNEVSARIKKYNRIALIIQGLFDRSEVLHPHPPVKTWVADGFAAAVQLVYDNAATLNFGDAPDFEAYRAACNARLNADSVVIGQELYWMQREAAKENKRIQNDWRQRGDRHYHKTFKPYGNKGPGYLAKMASFKTKSGQALFTWNRARQTSGRYYGDARRGSAIPTSITVPVTALFNVSAYRLGDYKRFFQDPRTRADYLKWAPLLIAAEEYHAGNLIPQEPIHDLP